MIDNNAAKIREELQNAELRYDQSVINNSPQEMLLFYQELTTPDFVEKDNPPGNVTTREQMLRMLEQVASAEQGIGYKELIHVETTVIELAIEADAERAIAVIVHSGHYIQTDAHGWHGPKGADVEVKQMDKWERVWRKTVNGWRLQLSRYIGPA